MENRAAFVNSESNLTVRVNMEEIAQFVDSDAGLLWLDVSVHDETTSDLLTKTFDLHTQAVHDSLQTEIQTARYQQYGDHEFVLAHGINYASESELVEIAELGIFIGRNFVVTTHAVDLLSIDQVFDEFSTGAVVASDPESLTFLILDRFMSHIRPTVDHMSDVIDDLEEAAINNPQPLVLAGLLRLKRSALRINRAMARQTEVLHSIGSAKKNSDFELGVSFQDLATRATRTFEINNVLRERADSAMTIYQGTLALKQNETMKVLAIITAIFLPLSLLAGIYGMNFVNIPELKLEWGYFAVLGVMLAFAISVIWWVWLRQRISVWKLGSKGLFSLKVPIDHVRKRKR